MLLGLYDSPFLSEGCFPETGPFSSCSGYKSDFSLMQGPTSPSAPKQNSEAGSERPHSLGRSLAMGGRGLDYLWAPGLCPERQTVLLGFLQSRLQELNTKSHVSLNPTFYSLYLFHNGGLRPKSSLSCTGTERK